MKIEFEKLTARIARYERQEEKQRLAWAKSNSSAIKTLRAKLLDIGGTSISPQPHPYIRFIADHGRPQDFPAIIRVMKPSDCHGNVFELWVNRTKRSRLVAICIGYALTDDGDGGTACGAHIHGHCARQREWSASLKPP